MNPTQRGRCVETDASGKQCSYQAGHEYGDGLKKNWPTDLGKFTHRSDGGLFASLSANYCYRSIDNARDMLCIRDAGHSGPCRPRFWLADAKPSGPPAGCDHVPRCQCGPGIGEGDIRLAADRALRFLAGLQLTDHPKETQRELLSIVRDLISHLRPIGGDK